MSAQNDLKGTWEVEGKNPKSESYSGTLNMEPVTSVMYRLKWDIKYENKSQRESFPGTGLYDKKSNMMFAAYGIGTFRYGLLEYPLNEKGGLEGSGSWTSHKGRGAELLAGKLKRRNIEGTYEVVGRRSKGDVELGATEAYKGTLKIKKDGDIYHLNWYLGDGTPYSGFGYVIDNSLMGVWGIGGSYGLEVYTFDKNMKKATSEWMTPNYDYEEGAEILTR